MLTPQAALVLSHLQRKGTITPVEAATVHKIRSLPRRILDLKKAGYDIGTVIKKDLAGQRYAEYHFYG